MSSLPTKFVFFIKSLTVSGGAERVFVDVVNGLSHRGMKIAVVSFDRAQASSFYLLSEDIAWTRLGIGDARRSARPIETVRRILAVRKMLKSDPGQVCVAFMHSSYLPVGIAALGTHTVVIGSEHIVPAHYETEVLQRISLHLAPRVVDAITVVSPSVKQLFSEPLQSEMVVVPNPVKVHVDALADTVGEGLSNKTLLSVGRLSKQKDYTTLVDAFARIKARQSDWNIRIVGDGPMRGALEQQVQDLELRDRVVLAGTTQDVGREYRSAQLFVLPSLYESQGLSAIEAIVHGLPVVAFKDCSGLSDFLIDNVNSQLVRGDDRVAALASTLEALMQDADRRASLVSPESIDLHANNFDRVLDQWISLLNRCKPSSPN